MSVFLTILKWIGIVLGGGIGLALVLLVLATFVPVTYRVRTILNEEKNAYGYRFGWMYPVVSFSKSMDSEQAKLRILGIPIGGKKKKPKVEKEQPVEQREEAGGSVNAPKPVPEKKNTQGTEKTTRTSKGKKERKKRFSFTKVSDIINDVKRQENKNAVALIWKELKALIVELRPRKIKGQFLIGTGDPCTTGLTFGGIALLPFVYDKKVHIVPDFDHRVCQGEGMIKGRIQIFYLIKLAIRLYQDKDLKKAYKNLKKKK
ncbi:MAG: DUF2953 domain-containing protein [Eubacterium sp.]|nr:DUF2953 domain-containing protein [Eubacterium sp.]